MNSWWDRFLRVTLTLMIVLSLFLSWKIWTKPASRGYQDRATNVRDAYPQKSMSEVYAPTKIFYHRDRGSKYLYTNKESSISELQKQLVAARLKKAQLAKSSTVDELMVRDNVFHMVYPATFPVFLFLDMYNLDLELPEQSEMALFNWLTVSLDTNRLYFLNRNDMTAIEVELEGNLQGLENTLKANSDFMSASLEDDHVGGLFYLDEEVELPIYSYIIATQSFTTFSKAFFNHSSDLYANESDHLNLSNSEGESLTIDSDTGEVAYFGQLKSTSLEGSSELYYNSFQYIEHLGPALGNQKYFYLSQDDIVYRNYVEGFPVFGESLKGSLEMSIREQNVYIKLNQNTLQIPIPSDDVVKLDPTETVIDSLVDKGADVDAISDLQIGYSWETSQETNQAIDLVPNWYVKYRGNWVSQTELEDSLTKGVLPDGL